MKSENRTIALGGADALISMDIVGYQFAQPTYDAWDSEWLLVKADVVSPDGGWSFENPCLTTFELAEMSEWLASVHSLTAEQSLNFTEPNICLEWGLGREGLWISFHFSQESSPPWCSPDDAAGTAYSLTVRPTIEELRAAASCSAQLAKKFPPRIPTS